MSQLCALEKDASWQPAVRLELKRAYDKVLSPFTDEPDVFRSVMRDTGSVISGSTALWYLMRMPDSWTPNDMDIVTPYSSFSDVLSYLMTLPGATLIDEQADDYRFLPGYCCRYRVRTTGGYIDILQSRTDSPLTVITGYWSTHVMNAMSADAFWSAYPSLTLAGIGIYNLTPEGGSYTYAVERHGQRGFRISSADDFVHDIDLGRTCDGYSACPRLDRVWGDEFTLKMPLTHDSVGSLMDSLVGTHTVAWRLGTPGCGNFKCLLDTDFRNYCVQWTE